MSELPSSPRTPVTGWGPARCSPTRLDEPPAEARFLLGHTHRFRVDLRAEGHSEPSTPRPSGTLLPLPPARPVMERSCVQCRSTPGPSSRGGHRAGPPRHPQTWPPNTCQHPAASSMEPLGPVVACRTAQACGLGPHCPCPPPGATGAGAGPGRWRQRLASQEASGRQPHWGRCWPPPGAARAGARVPPSERRGRGLVTKPRTLPGPGRLESPRSVNCVFHVTIAASAAEDDKNSSARTVPSEFCGKESAGCSAGPTGLALTRGTAWEDIWPVGALRLVRCPWVPGGTPLGAPCRGRRPPGVQNGSHVVWCPSSHVLSETCLSPAPPPAPGECGGG